MLILRWIINALALLVVAALVPGISLQSFYAALIAALVLGLVNAVVRPIVLLLTLPINLLTLGSFTLIINALMLLLVSSVVKGFVVSGFSAAFWGGIVLWLISWAINSLIHSPDHSVQQ